MSWDTAERVQPARLLAVYMEFGLNGPLGDTTFEAASANRSNPEIREIKGLLKDLYGAVLEGHVSRQAAAVANQMANTQLRAIELERRIREHSGLEDRLDELEALLDEAETRTHARW